MGFSVSASAAIIFISFLMAASTLYIAWDNAYTDVQAAQEYWSSLRISQLNTLISLNSSIGTYKNTSTYYNVTFHIRDSGITMYVPDWSGVYDGKLVTLSNVKDDNVGFLKDYTYVIPGDVLYLNVTYIPLQNDTHNLTLVFGNGCWLRLSWQWNGNRVVLTGLDRGCPTEVI